MNSVSNNQWTVSHSQLSTFSTCGEQYRLQKVIGVAEKPSFWLIAGKVLHRVVEDYDYQSLNGVIPSPDEDEIISKIKVYWEQELSELEDVEEIQASRNEDQEWWLKSLPEQVQNYLNWRRDTGWHIWESEDGQSGIETRVEGVLGGQLMIGYVDRVFINDDGQLAVLDLKTGRNAPKHPQQLGTYSVLMNLTFNAKPDVGYFYHTRTVRPRGQEPRHGTLIGPYDLRAYTADMLSTMVSALVRAREHDVYVPSVGSLCPSCGVREHCYAWKASQGPDLIDLKDHL